MERIQRLLKTLTLSLALAGFATGVNAQSTANYAFTTNTTGSLAADANGNVVDMTTGTTQLVAASSDANASAVTTLPSGFTFYFMSVPYTQFSASADGWVGLGNAAVSGTTNTNATATTPKIAALGGDLYVGASGKVHYKIVGTSPNRCLVIEFQNMAVFYSTTASNAINVYQVRLYETTSTVEFIYGRMYCGSATYSPAYVGLAAGTTANTQASVTTSSNTASTGATFNTNSYTATTDIPNLNSTTNGNRRIYTFTPLNTTPADPTSLTFTAVGSGSTTVNWVDNSSSESYFIVTRATDAAFTQNVVTSLVASTTTTGTGTSYNVAQTGLAVSTTYYYKIQAANEGAPPSAGITGQQASTGAQTITSATSGNWSAPATWSGGIVPSSSDGVTISDGTTVTIDNTTPACSTLTVGGGTSGVLQYLLTGTTASTLTVGTNVSVTANGVFNAGTGGTNTGTKTLSLGGNLAVEGTFNMDGGTNMQVGVTFTGATNNTISGMGTTCSFYSITENKGTTQTGATLDVQRVIMINTPTTAATRLTLTNGTFKISSASTLRPYYGAATICAATARMWLANAGAVLGVAAVNTTGSAGAPTVTGELRIDAGAFEYGGGANTLGVGTNGTLNITGGTLTMYGAISLPSNTTTQFLMSGGEIFVRPQGANALGTGTNSFDIGASTSVTWSGGRITIVDPHSAAGGLAFSMAAGGTKTVTGGTLRLGDGTSTLSGGTLGTTSGFGLSIASPVGIYNLELNNRTDASQSRMARLTANSYVANQVIGQPNSYLWLGSSTTGYILYLPGSTPLALDATATVSGTQIGASTAPLATSTVYFYGTSPQSFTAGTNLSPYIISIANPTTVTYTGSGLVAVRVNAFIGSFSFSPGAFTIGRTDALPVIQVGGSTTAAPGSFANLPTINTSFGLPNLIYAPNTSASSYTMGAYNEIGAATATSLSALLVGKNLSAARDLTVGGTLTLTGNLLLGSSNLTLGTSGTVLGTISGTSLVVTTGSITRWFGTTASPTTATLSSGGFPFGTPAFENRTANVYFNTATAASTAGTITLTHNNVSGIAAVSPAITDAGATIDTRSNSSWVGSTGNGLTLTGTASLSLTGAGVFTPTTVTNLRLIRTADVVGTNVTPSGTTAAPVVARSGLSAADLGSTFYFGAPATDLGLTAVASGNWGDPALWDRGVVPTATDVVGIAGGKTVTIAGMGGAGNYTANAVSLIIFGTLVSNDATNTLAVTNGVTNNGTTNLSNGTFNVGIASSNTSNGYTNNNGSILNASGGTLNIGPAGGGKNPLTNNTGALLNVTGGTLNVNGNVVTAGTFNQSAGAIVVDGNAANVVANSVASGTVLVSVTSAAGTVTGGTLTIVDPPATGTSRSLEINLTSGNLQWAPTHTTIMGGASTTDASSGTVGFAFDTYVGSTNTQSMIGSLVINGGNGTNRYTSVTTSTADGSYVNGTLTVNAGSELRQITNNTTLVVAGKLINNGLFTAGAIVRMGTFTGSTASSSTQTQTIEGTGTFQNALTTPTASFMNLVIQNSTAVTLSVPASMSGVLSLTNGALNTSSTGLLTLTATAATTGASNASFVNGPIAKTGNTAFTFPVGRTGTGYQPVAISAPATATTTFTAEYLRSNPNAASPKAAGLVRVSNCDYWTLNRANSTDAVNVTLNFSATSNCGSGSFVTDLTSLVVAHFDGTTWDAYGNNATSGTTTAGSVTWNAVSNFSPFALGSTNTAANPLPITFVAVSAHGEGTRNRIDWTVADAQNLSHYEVEKQTGASFTTLEKVPASNEAAYAFYDVQPNAGRNVYRVKAVSLNGSPLYSSAVTVLVKEAGFSLEVFPNPTRDLVNVRSSSTTPATITVTDLSGRIVVRQEAVTGTAQVNLQPLAAGTYLLIWNDGAHQETIRVTRQ